MALKKREAIRGGKHKNQQKKAEEKFRIMISEANKKVAEAKKRH